jgi:glycosyltransferase involved in cell wall biosynthesis
MDISIVIPSYNEEKNVKDLYLQISSVLKSLKKDYEIIFIDDGSTDNTYKELQKLNSKDNKVRVIKFRKNFGQTQSWSAGFAQAKGKFIITMDSDLQNDPKDIPKLLKKLNEGYDVVSGWRQNRKDTFFKRIFSLFSRFLRQNVIKDEIHDSGCSLKVYKKECIEDLDLHGEMHRYIAEILALKGYKLGEIKVNHRKRKSGKTKYNLIRLPKGFLDLIVVAFWQKFANRPIHLFGGLGIISTILGFFSGMYLLYEKFFLGLSIANRPLLLLSSLLVIVGIQFIIFGLIADILMKIYFTGERKSYSIEKVL